jgi:hypothetical protein
MRPEDVDPPERRFICADCLDPKMTDRANPLTINGEDEVCVGCWEMQEAQQ